MSPFKKKSIYAVLLGLLLGFFLIGFILNIIFPTQFIEVRQRFQMWRVGAQAIVPTDEIKGLELDRCGISGIKGSVEEIKKNCACLILIHGMGDQLSTWRKLFFTDEKTWASPVRILAIDLPGFGGSPIPKDPAEYSVNQTAEKLSKFLSERQFCEKNIVVGNSYGGWVATRLAIEHPGQVQKLVLIGSNGLKPSSEEEKEALKLFKNPSVDTLKEFQRRAYFKARDYPDRFWRMAYLRAKKSNTLQVVAAQTDQDYLDHDLSRLKTPVIYVRGEADQVVNEKQSQALLAKIPHAELKKIPECGHLPQKECPEKLISILNKSLN
jgi:2-hydroxy-6-oxo-octa-2,4-dienoate hydrolase